MSTDGKREGDTGIKHRLHSIKEPGGKGSTTNAPQRASTLSSSGSRWTLPPTSSSLLLHAIFLKGHINWQKHTPLYSEKPQGMIRLLETIFRTHGPTWDDIIQLLVSLRHRILTEVRKWLREMAPEGTINWQWWTELVTPDERPNWDYNTEEGKGLISAGCFTRPQEGGPKAHEYGEAHRNN